MMHRGAFVMHLYAPLPSPRMNEEKSHLIKPPLLHSPLPSVRRDSPDIARSFVAGHLCIREP